MENKFWEGAISPGQIFGNVYFVGTRPASSHLIDTGDGLILIDPGFPEAFDTLTENIRTLGFDSMNIRIILISHGHYDHAGAAIQLKQMTGARIYVGEGDLKMVTGEDNSSLAELFGVRYTQSFIPDVLLGDNDVITLGNTEILCLCTPGHTDGTMSFFFDVSDGERTFRAGMFGGAGLNTLRGTFLTSHRVPYSNRDKFFASVNRLKREKVEIFLGNHVGNNETAGKLERVKNGETDAFLAPSEWLEFLENRELQLKKMIERERAMAETVEKILEEKLIMIVRGVHGEELIKLAEAMWRGGIRAMECTFDATGTIPDETTAKEIAELAERFDGRMLIGAGTVLKESQVNLATSAGGKFIVSPNTNADVIKFTKKLGLVSIPGALSPTEIALAHTSGADFVKLFPITNLGVSYFKAVSAPLSAVKYLAVGGIDDKNMKEYLDAGVSGFGIGSNIVNKKLIEGGDFEKITELSRRYVEAVK